jgi:hypothetical protein
MRVTATRLFDFLNDTQSHAIERHEVISAEFSNLRQHLRPMIVALSDTGDNDAVKSAHHVRTVLSEWLTAPVPFGDSMLRVLEDIGRPSDVEARWGRDVRVHCDEAVRAVRILSARENPIREETAKKIRLLRDEKRSFRIYCHRRSRRHFDSLSAEYGIAALPSELFIHSVVEYRTTEPFDCLLKVGPLRSRGWGSAPDAVLTAPRFKTLVQLIWSGCSDESDFGYDPIPRSEATDTTHTGIDKGRHYERSLRLTWEMRTVTSRASSTGANSAFSEVADLDDLDVISHIAAPSDLQRALLVQFDEAYGILYPPSARVLSFDGGPQSIEYRSPGETLEAGMYLVLPVEDDISLAGLQAEEGHCSARWKEALSREFLCDPSGLIGRLREAGLRLRHMDVRIEHWCKPASTVIHAPKQMLHFEILMRVLGLDFETDAGPRRSQRVRWWQFAWDEVRRARGEAVKTGVLENQIIDEERLRILRALGTDIRPHVGAPRFEVPIPSPHAIRGVFKFFRVLAIEGGYRAPPTELKVICDLANLDQWRV